MSYGGSLHTVAFSFSPSANVFISFFNSVLQECILIHVTTKSKNADSFHINYAYIDKNGKSTSRIYKKIGTFKELSEKLNTDCDGALAD